MTQNSAPILSRGEIQNAIQLYKEFRYKEAMEMFKTIDLDISLMYLGEMCMNGQGVLRNEEKAYEYFVKLDKDPYALFQVAYILENQMKFEKSFMYYELSAKYDYPPALNYLGLLYKTGRNNTEVNIDKSLHYYEQSCKMGNITAAYNLAKLYHYKLNDMKTAIKYYEMAAEKGDLESLHFLACRHFQHGNIELSKQYLEKCIEYPPSEEKLKELTKNHEE